MCQRLKLLRSGPGLLLSWFQGWTALSRILAKTNQIHFFWNLSSQLFLFFVEIVTSCRPAPHSLVWHDWSIINLHKLPLAVRHHNNWTTMQWNIKKLITVIGQRSLVYLIGHSIKMKTLPKVSTWLIETNSYAGLLGVMKHNLQSTVWWNEGDMIAKHFSLWKVCSRHASLGNPDKVFNLALAAVIFQ